MDRKNGILTYTNTLFYPLSPQMDEVKIEDIAHALSQMCRANGHFKSFYSVAQHSIHCAEEAKARGLSGKMQLVCLLHDASEAYISDITRPVKCYLEEYRKIEEKLQSVIYEKFGICNLTKEECRQLQEIDNALLHHEFKCLHYRGIYEDSPKLYRCHDFTEKNMVDIEKQFIQLAQSIVRNQLSENS